MSGEGGWYCVVDGEPVGPMDRQELLAKLPSAGGREALVYGPGTPDWTAARHVASLAAELAGAGGPPPTPTGRTADEIDYEIFGDDMQFVEVTLDPDEVVVAEAGGMLYMTEAPDH